jgi:uncharacterized protein (DUF2344 family)
MERTGRRAGLAMRRSQGFNPRAKLSLVCPRPVAVASAATARPVPAIAEAMTRNSITVNEADEILP